MTEIVFLGVGSAMPDNPADNHTALLVRDEKVTLLVDCGPTIMRQLEKAGISAGELTHIYVSHQHGDHCLGYPVLLLKRALAWPTRSLWVLGVPAVLDVLKRLTAMVYPDVAARVEAIVCYVPLRNHPEGEPLPGINAVRCSVAQGKHSVASWALRLDLPSGRSLVYSADTGPSENLAALASAATLLIHEAYYVEARSSNNSNHSAATQVGKIAAQAGVDTLVIVHRQDTTPEAAVRYRAAAAQAFKGRIVVPMAGDRLVL